MPGPPKGVRIGGRQKGTPNKEVKSLRAIAESLGVNPFEFLLRFAKGDWKGLGYDSPTRIVSYTQSGEAIYDDVIKPEIRFKAASEATQYLEPKRKAIEHSGPGGGPIESRDLSNLTDEQLDAKLAAFEAKRSK